MRTFDLKGNPESRPLTQFECDYAAALWKHLDLSNNIMAALSTLDHEDLSVMIRLMALVKPGKLHETLSEFKKDIQNDNRFR